MDSVDQATRLQGLQEEVFGLTLNTPKPYECFIAGVGSKVIEARSPSDCISQIEEKYGVGRPGEEHLFAIRVPHDHNRGGDEYRGGRTLIDFLKSSTTS